MFFKFALIGTTASGKSALANALAKDLDAILLSLDSLCVYKQINIASAKPDKAELAGLDYFGLDLIDVDESFNVGLFFKEYQKAEQKAMKLDKPLIIVGGTSFYLNALMNGLSEFSFNKNLTAKNLSNEEIYHLMQKIDKESKIHANDTYRLQKWFEIYQFSKPVAPSEFLKKAQKKPLIKELDIFELVVDKELLREKIALRTKQMFQKGLLEEASFLFHHYDKGLKPLNSIGLKECGEFLRGELSKNELETLINTHTAQLAKRQRTFNKKFDSIKLEDKQALEKIKNYIQK